MEQPVMRVRFEILTAAHPVKAFCSTNQEMNDYLVKRALQNQATGYGVVTIAIADPGTAVVGYLQLCPASIAVAQLPDGLTAGFPGYPAPAILLARLAVDQTAAGQGLGKRLLIHAFRAALQVKGIVGFRFLIVDAIDQQAVGFYQKFGFIALPVDAARPFPQRLYLHATTVATAVRVADGQDRAQARRDMGAPPLQS